ncbi:MAG: RNA polymerase sigma factor [Verrucomicrobia bacterium]|nr:RNA polymerase sigma factor [Verrucomicrobiota bacterium]
MDPDLPLITALQAGDHSALNAIIERHQDALFGFAWRQVRHETDARDITQEVFVRVYTHRHKFREKQGSFRAWLFRITANLCTDHLRKLGRTPTALTKPEHPGDERGQQALAEVPSDILHPGEQAARESDLAQLRQAISRLPPALREPLVLFTLEERSQQECAELLGISAKAVEMKVRRARAELQQMLAAILDRE